MAQAQLQAQQGSQGTGSTATGVACGMGAGALWGLVFLAPELVPQFSPLQQTIGRYLAYGLIAALLIAPRWRLIAPHIGRREWLALGWLALTGNTLYYILLATAVQMGGIAMTSLIVGLIPVTVTIIGSRDKGAVPLRRLAPSLMLCAAGVLCIGWHSLSGGTAAAREDSTSPTQIIGLLCAVGALLSWTLFAVGNSRWLHRLEHVSAHDWSLLNGVVTGGQSLLLIPISLLLYPAAHSDLDWAQLAGVSIAVAVFASIVGNALWNRMSRLLPLTMVGQMILFETLFALIYGFIWEARLPDLLELTAFALVVLGVLSCIAAHRRPAEPIPHADAVM